MNTVLHLADSALQYYRGKQTGLWGLVGIALALVVFRFWDSIAPIFEFLGIVSLMDKLGLIHESSGVLTAYRIFWAFIAFYFLLVIVGLILLGIVSLLAIISQNQVGKVLFKIAVYLMLFPIFTIASLNSLYLYSKDKKEQKRDPELYAERQRLAKNHEVIEIIRLSGVEEERKRKQDERDIDDWELTFDKKGFPIFTPPEVDVEDNEISFEDAFNRLNRLPTKKDYFFLIGVTHERDIYMLFPRPFKANGVGHEGKVFCEKLDIKKFDERFDKPVSIFNVPKEMIVKNADRTNTRNLNELYCKDWSEFELLFDPNRSKDLLKKFESYTTNSIYGIYVDYILDEYFNRKNFIIEELKKEMNKERFDSLLAEVQTYDAGNEDVVKIIWEEEKLQWKPF
ncbi:hypothetical protein [Bacillus sp. AFS040349]|uniref:hypothetical protein n=1 Tax=Bacillus sp. AFS040349 TaxID=2033502 RepID=UPI000BFCD5F1|nr:hypothetical protein [Bacillus sp. AFS040349]PGT80571.1 hypothetical protein COD11_20895 [Bacillus sp. AFS040349]